jgi:predicted alpha-1,2-mannosidase
MSVKQFDMRRLFLFLICLSALALQAQTDHHTSVDPFIGTGGHGHTYPGPTMPFGMVQLSPDTRLDGWDGCGGYHYSDSVIYGFSHTHLQGTGVSDYGDILIMPCTRFAGGQQVWRDRYKSSFDKSSEKAHAGYYSVDLVDSKLKVELTTTNRVGIHKYTLDTPDTLTLIIDLAHRDKLINYSIYPIDDSTIVGHRISENWAEQQHVYFAMRFNKNFNWSDQLSENKIIKVDSNGVEHREMSFVPVFAADFGVVDELTVKVGLSFCDIEGAINNLNTEAPHYDFKKYLDNCEEAWDEQLSRIEIEGETPEESTIFYTSLYHSCTVPNLASDADGRYRGTNLRVHQLSSEDGLHYTVFSLWDTFRSLHPLLSLLEPERTRDFVRTMLRMYEDGGQLPVWELAGNYTGCMIGYHSIPVIADAKDWGIEGWNEELALEAMLQAADSAHLGLDSYAERGYIPSECESESVSKTLEYSFDDACISQFALQLGYEDIASRFLKRSHSWRNLMHPETDFIQPKRDGAWIPSYDPTEVNFNYTEANGWQYTFFAPHDITGMISLAGSPTEFSELVDNQFTTDLVASGRNQADITGLVGQYAHGNEPSHHVAYLQSYAGKQWRTAQLVDSILTTLYTDKPDGLCGNEDCGQMSAWYVLSSLGLYSVAPGSGSAQLAIGSPQFNRATITPKGGLKYVINKKGDGRYIETANGSKRAWLSYNEVTSGGSLEFIMSDDWDNGFGLEEADRPREQMASEDFVAVPGFKAPQSFQGDYALLELSAVSELSTIYYHNGNGKWRRYKRPIKVFRSMEFYAKSVEGSIESDIVHHSLVQIEHDWEVVYTYPYSHQYAAAGDNSLVDGLKGGDEFRTGDWQGFYATPFEATIDLGEVLIVEGMSLGCVQDVRPWIWLPENVEFYSSADGAEFKLIERVTHDIPEDYYDKTVFRFITEVNTEARFIRVKANPRGKIPTWHLGAGFDRWTFVDEWQITLGDE